MPNNLLDQVINQSEKVTEKAFLRKSCTVRSIVDDSVFLGVKTPFLQDIGTRLSTSIADNFSKVLGRKMTVIFVVNE